MMEEQAIRIIATRGPVLPVLIAKETGSNTMIAGAVLSKLVGDKRIFMSRTKIGGSSVYYLKEQAPKLQELYKYLNEKDRRTYDLLKKNIIIRDTEHDALTRVSLRNIKDFAVPLEVTLGDKTEIFWKWYLTSDEQATSLIRDFLKIGKETEKLLHREKIEEKMEIEMPLSTFVKQEKKIEKIEEKEEIAEKPGEKKIERQLEKPIEKQQLIEAQPETELIKTSDAFASKIIRFLKEKQIIVKNMEIKKKNSEIDFIVSIPSIVGSLECYGKAKNKAKISDSDLSGAYVQGQLKKLPVMFITPGELTKKASQLLEKDVKINFIKI